jgi:SAM-dependent methyltransferase
VLWQAVTERAARSISRRGWWGTLALLPRLMWQRTRSRVNRLRPSVRRARAQTRALERAWGIETIAQVAGGDTVAGVHARAAVKYQPTPTQDFLALLDMLDIDHTRFLFIDVGAGKGRTLCAAALRPFRRVLGVEFSPALCSIAERNLARFHHPRQRCRELAVVCADAAELALPPEPAVIYLYNPFNEEVMAPFVANLAASLAAQPRELHVVYYNALQRRLFDACPALRVAAQGGPPLAEPWVIFSTR